MDQLQTFEAFLAAESVHISTLDFSINLLLTALLCFLLGQIYIRYGNSLSNRRSFAHNLLVVGSTTMLIITIVKSSLALSLGLVGALSIVRFRAAIKEPEELSFLFLCIAIGLGFGAGQRIITFIGFGLIAVIIYTKRLTQRKESDSGLFLMARCASPSDTTLEDITNLAVRHSTRVDLKRLDQTEDHLEVGIALNISTASKLSALRKDLMALAPPLTITIIDNN